MTDEVRHFEEDEICDHCGMEIYGAGVPSGYAAGSVDNEWTRTGWMHQDVTECEMHIEEEGHLRLWQDGEYTSPEPPPNRRKAS